MSPSSKSCLFFLSFFLVCFCLLSFFFLNTPRVKLSLSPRFVSGLFAVGNIDYSLKNSDIKISGYSDLVQIQD